MKTLKSYNKYFESNEIVTRLDLSAKKLIKLPELPNTLKILNCESNKLTELPELPYTLEKLECYNNNLTKLPDLSSLTNLTYLDFFDNDVLYFNNIQTTKLKYLDCSYNKLTELPELPDTLEELNCNNNNLPYNNLNDYWKWYYKKHPDKKAARDFNI